MFIFAAMKIADYKSEIALLIATIAMLVVIFSLNDNEEPKIIVTSSLSPKKTITYSPQQITQINDLMMFMSDKRKFNGAMLIGQKDSILYTFSHGFADYKTRDTITDTTAFQLASVSKQFTAVAILQLYEQGKLQLNDKVISHLPSFPYADITIHQLLVHRSGLPNYCYLCDRKKMLDDEFFSNQQIVSELIEANAGRYFYPNRRFQYSNTGYAVLAAVVEAVSGLKFESYLQQNIFQPLKMRNTFAYRAMKSVDYPQHATGYVASKRRADDNYLDHFLGDKGIYSTITDLFTWDQALYTDKIINHDTLQLAFRPMGMRPTARTNYGYGWRLATYADSIKIQYHSGWWHGFKTMLVRVPQDTTTIVVLRNNSNRSGGVSFNQILSILYPSALPDNINFEETDSVAIEADTNQVSLYDTLSVE